MPEYEASFAKPAEDTMMAALFSTAKAPPPQPHDHSKWHIFREKEDPRTRKMEFQNLEVAKRPSLMGEKDRQLSSIEFTAEMSSSRVV